MLRDVCIGSDEDAPHAAKYAPNGNRYTYYKMKDFNRNDSKVSIIFGSHINPESFKVCIYGVWIK